MATIFHTAFSNYFFNENARISSQISIKQVSLFPNSNNAALVKMISLPRLGDKPLAEPKVA